MAQWITYLRSDGSYGFMYVSAAGTSEKLGGLRKDTPDNMLVDWIVDKNPMPGDFIKLISGRCLLVSTFVGSA